MINEIRGGLIVKTNPSLIQENEFAVNLLLWDLPKLIKAVGEKKGLISFAMREEKHVDGVPIRPEVKISVVWQLACVMWLCVYASETLLLELEQVIRRDFTCVRLPPSGSRGREDMEGTKYKK